MIAFTLRQSPRAIAGLTPSELLAQWEGDKLIAMPDRPTTDFKVEVTFDAAKGYIAIHPELPPITALSLGGLRRRIEERLIGEDVDVHLILDAVARRERDRRHAASP